MGPCCEGKPREAIPANIPGLLHMGQPIIHTLTEWAQRKDIHAPAFGVLWAILLKQRPPGDET